MRLASAAATISGDASTPSDLRSALDDLRSQDAIAASEIEDALPCLRRENAKHRRAQRRNEGRVLLIIRGRPALCHMCEALLPSTSPALTSSGLPDIQQLRVEPVSRDQLVVRAALDDAPLVQDEDEVGFLDRRQPVRDDERRLAREQAVERPRTPAAPTPRRGRSSARRESGSRASRTIARAMPSRCRCPPDSVSPPCPTIVS